MSLIDSEAPARRTMVLFFLVDASSSMEGKKIAAVNDAVRNVLPMIQEISDSNADAEIKVAALKFSSGTEWINDRPRLASEYEWLDVEAEGLTDMGEAFRELNSKLSRKSFFDSDYGYYAPAVILLSDGAPTDDYMSGVKKLKDNKWYKVAIKIAIAIGDDAEEDVLVKFTGNKEAVFKVHNIESLKKIIHLAAVSSSTIGSQSTTGDSEKSKKVIEAMNTQIANDEILDGVKNVAEEETVSDKSAKPSDSLDDWD